MAGRQLTDGPPPAGGFSSERLASLEAIDRAIDAGMNARVRALPASDARVHAGPPPPQAEQTVARGALRSAADPGPMVPGDAVFFRSSQLAPPAGSVFPMASPSVAQNGKNVMEIWSKYLGRSQDGGATWTYSDPGSYDGMSDFSGYQDVVYDKGIDRVIWERGGSFPFSCGANCTQNRILLDVLASDFNTINCSYDIRASGFGISNGFLDRPQLSLSDKFGYISMNAFDQTTFAFLTHIVGRVPLDQFKNCVALIGDAWEFTQGWGGPALIENAKDVMYMGDQVVTNQGLNDQFLVYWLYEDQITLNYVQRTLANPYTFTNHNASCPVPGGANPCGTADQHISGAVLLHNSPLPGNVGAAADKVNFYWNVAQGNGFSFPYVEAAGFHGGTILQVQRPYVFSTTDTWLSAAAGANDRQHEALSLLRFFPSSQPEHYIAINDDYNGNPPPWEVYSVATSPGPWAASTAGPFLRTRLHAPVGEGWIATGYLSNGTTGPTFNYIPNYVVFGRSRDSDGFNRFDQK
jgi:hypothetical protein